MKRRFNTQTPLNRRAFFKYGSRLSILAALGFGFAGRNDLTIEQMPLAFKNLPPEFDGLKIVQISDIHASFWVGSDFLNEVVDRINSIPKDLVVITGDIITGSVNDFWKRWLFSAGDTYVTMVIDALSRLDSGVKFAVLGNHDQWDGKETELRLVRELERVGIQVLRNQSTQLQRGAARINIAGTDDYWFSCDINRALGKVPPDEFTILLSHNPDIVSVMGNDPKIDLRLCGHTHGGQVNIPHVTEHFMPIKNAGKYLHGLVREPSGYTYVNRGIGTLVFPFRIGAPPEITAFTLTRS